MQYQNLYIAYVNPDNPLDTFTLQYKLRDHAVTAKWCERVELAQAKYTIDDPCRFYGLGPIEKRQIDAISKINAVIDTINDFEKIIDRKLKFINDQDTLNYLHHIFEEYHGLLDKQTHDFWLRAPDNVRKALADLNILVHRCESTYRNSYPRHVVTYFGLPKTKKLTSGDYELFEDQHKFGTVCLNYVEIGKTLENLAVDNDQYVGDDAFRPWRHYSADFNIRFWSDSDRQIEEKHAVIKQYYDINQEFFIKRKLPWGHNYLRSGSIALADLQYTGSQKELLQQLESHQQVKEVILL